MVLNFPDLENSPIKFPQSYNKIMNHIIKIWLSFCHSGNYRIQLFLFDGELLKIINWTIFTLRCYLLDMKT